jgi:hypothetical protein
LDVAFLRHLGDKKDFLYYIKKIGSLKRKEGESDLDFSKRFNRMYNNVSTKINPTEASSKFTYASDFDPDFLFL